MTAERRTPNADGSTTEPQPCDLLIVGGRVLDRTTELGADDRVAVAIRAGIIVALGDEADIRKAWRPARHIDASGHAVAAGFVDAHVHLSAFRGAGRAYQKAVTPGPFSGAGKVKQVLPMIAKLVSMSIPSEVTDAVLRPRHDLDAALGNHRRRRRRKLRDRRAP